MLIPIKRIYLSGVEADIVLNTRFIYKLEPCNKRGTYIKTRIVMPGLSRRDPTIMYTNYTISYIKGLLTKAQNKKQEDDE